MNVINVIFIFAFAFIVYGAGPLYVATEWKKHIYKLRYWLFCVLYDAAVFIVSQLVTGSDIPPVSLAVTALLFGTIFYFIGLSILYKHGMVAGSPTQPATPPVQPAAPQPPAEPETASAPTPEPIPEPASAPKPQETPTQSLSPSPITETWYTCPSCGCLLPTGEICSCGYHPQADAPTQPQAPVKKRRPSVAVIILAVALACSAFYNAVQASEKATLRNDLSQVDAEIASYKKTIQDYKDAISSAREQNMYLKEDLSHLCQDLPINFSDLEFRHNFRNSPYYYEGTAETVSYWWRIELDFGDFFR